MQGAHGVVAVLGFVGVLGLGVLRVHLYLYLKCTWSERTCTWSVLGVSVFVLGLGLYLV